MIVFVSHNKADKEFARSLGSLLSLGGADVWFDEWEVRAGDSIPGKLNEGLETFDTFVLIWSEDAARSDWVRRELEVAIVRGVHDGSTRVIPVRLDDADLPALLRHVRDVDAVDMSPREVAMSVLGMTTDRAWLKAVQETLEEADIEVAYFPGYGPIVGCPRCGAGLETIEGWHQTDWKRDDEYAGARCRECRWEGGGEL